MKFTKNLQPQNLTEFWIWFSEHSQALANEPECAALFAELDARLHKLDPGLSWEIGPGQQKPWQFVVSPNLDGSLRNVARKIVARAPALDDWEFHSARQPKDWDFHLELSTTSNGIPMKVDASNWTFVLLEYPDGIREILLRAPDLPKLTQNERREVAEIVLESALGEGLFLDAVDEFDLVDILEPRFADQERPIQRLRQAVIGPSGRVPFGKPKVN
jgi:hypothetical protein